MNDYMLKATAGNGSVRAYIIDSTQMVTEAATIHKTSVTATAAFGRLLTGTSLIGAMQKNDNELVTLSIQGDGPIRGIVATSDSTGNVKGYVFEPTGEMPLTEAGKIDVGGGIGAGSLFVIKDIGYKEPSVGQVALVSGEIAEDIAHYFVQSEQTPSAVVLGVLVDRDHSVKKAGGYIIQVMPGVSDDVITNIEQNIKNSPSITKLLNENNTPEDILKLILGDMDITIHEKMDKVKYFCNCDRNSIEDVLFSIGVKELKLILEEDKQATVHCHFCNKDYKFDEQQLVQLIDKLEERKKSEVY